MNKDQLLDRANRLREVNEIIKEVEPEIRIAAFSLLQGYISGADTKRNEPPGDQVIHGVNQEEFFSRFSTEKPADNALLLAAYHFSEHGSAPFTIEELRSDARDVGLTLPERVDMTFRQARRDGKSLFQVSGRGAFRPTVHGELFFRNTYEVQKGTKQKITDAGSEPS